MAHDQQDSAPATHPDTGQVSNTPLIHRAGEQLRTPGSPTHNWQWQQPAAPPPFHGAPPPPAGPHPPPPPLLSPPERTSLTPMVLEASASWSWERTLGIPRPAGWDCCRAAVRVHLPHTVLPQTGLQVGTLQYLASVQYST